MPVERGLVQIVQRQDDHKATLGRQPADQAQDFGLKLQIQAGSRLIQEQDAGFLSQSPRDDHPPPLAPGKFRDRAIAHRTEPHIPKRLLDDPPIKGAIG